MRVLIIPEDPRLDRYVLEPVVERIFDDLGCKARIEVLPDPQITGADHILQKQTVQDILDDHPMIDLFLLLVDRDCNRKNMEERVLERQAEHQEVLIGAVAHQEVEVWALAPHRRALPERWGDVRAHCDPKEAFFDPFIRGRGWLEGVGHGRKRAMRDFGAAWAGVLEVCPEIADLKERIGQWLDQKEAHASS